jgi:hypothetical protein
VTGAKCIWPTIVSFRDFMGNRHVKGGMEISKTKLEEIWCGDVDWIAIAQDRVKLRDLVNTGIDIMIYEL